MPSLTSPRSPLTRARFFLARAEALSGFEQEAFDNYVQAAMVFGQSVYEYLASAPGADEAYRDWLRATGIAMEADPVLAYFRRSRNLLVHRRHVPVQRRIFGTGSFTAHSSMYGEGRVTRSEPWYRRSVGILWHNAIAPAMRPIRRLRYRLGEAVKRRRRAVWETVEARRTRWRNRKVVPTVREFYLDDPDGLDRPAVDLVRTCLDRLEAVVVEAEALFPTVVG